MIRSLQLKWLIDMGFMIHENIINYHSIFSMSHIRCSTKVIREIIPWILWIYPISKGFNTHFSNVQKITYKI